MLRLGRRMTVGIRLGHVVQMRRASSSSLSGEVIESMLDSSLSEGDVPTATMLVTEAAKVGHMTNFFAETRIAECLENGLLDVAVTVHHLAKEQRCSLSHATTSAILKECIEHMKWRGAAASLQDLVMPGRVNAVPPAEISATAEVEPNDVLKVTPKILILTLTVTLTLTVLHPKVLGGLSQNVEHKPVVLDLLSALVKSPDAAELTADVTFRRIKATAKAFGYWQMKPAFLEKLPRIDPTLQEQRHRHEAYKIELQSSLDKVENSCLRAIDGGHQLHHIYAAALCIGALRDKGSSWGVKFLSRMLAAYDSNDLDSFQLLVAVGQAVLGDVGTRPLTLAVLQALALQLHRNASRPSPGPTSVHVPNAQIFSIFWKLAHELENRTLTVWDGARALVVNMAERENGIGNDNGAGTKSMVSSMSAPTADRVLAAALGWRQEGEAQSSSSPSSSRHTKSHVDITCADTVVPRRGRNNDVTDTSGVQQVYDKIAEIIESRVEAGIAGKKQSALSVVPSHESTYRRRLFRVLIDEMAHPSIDTHRFNIKLDPVSLEFEGPLPFDLCIWSKYLPQAHKTCRSLDSILAEDVRRDGGDGDARSPPSHLPSYFSRSGSTSVPGRKGARRSHGMVSRQLEGYPLYWQVVSSWLDSLSDDELVQTLLGGHEKDFSSMRYCSSAWGLVVLDSLMDRYSMLILDDADINEDGHDDDNESDESPDGFVPVPKIQRAEALGRAIGRWVELTVIMASRRKDGYAALEAIRAVMSSHTLPQYLTRQTVLRAAHTLWALRKQAIGPWRRQVNELWLLTAPLAAIRNDKD